MVENTMRIASLSLALIAFPHIAMAHDNWISRNKFHDPQSGEWCCSEHDCTALDDVRIQHQADGYVIDRKYFVAHKRVLPSHDGRYWACYVQNEFHPRDRLK